MSVFREMTIQWDGDEYTVTPSMALMRRIEQNGISLTTMAMRTAKGDAPISHIAYVLQQLLAQAGASVEEDDVYAALITGSEKQATHLVEVVLSAFAPSSGEGETKNRAARRARAAVGRKKPTRKKTPAA